MLNFTTVSHMLMTLPGISSSTNASSAQLYIFAERAEDLIKAKLSKRYVLETLTSSPPPLPLRRIATYISLYDFLALRVFTQERSNNSEWPDRYKESMALLDEIAAGEVPLIGSGGVVLPGTTSQVQVWSSTMNYLPTMTEDDETVQVVDENKIRDIEEDRRQFGSWWPT